MNNTRDDIDRCFDYNIDLSANTLYLLDEIDALSAEQFIKGLAILESKSDKKIIVKLSTPGGDWYSGMVIYDAIKMATSEIEIIGSGWVMSMGTVIMQASNNRILTPEATFMIHQGSDVLVGKTNDTIAQAREAERTMERMEHIFMGRIKEKNPNFKREKLKKMLSTDTYLDAKQTLELGLIDGIRGLK